MKDNRWYHLEFESDSITKDDLKRFREYEAIISRTYGVAVTTIVVCSSKIKNLMSEFTEGLNTYRVKVIRIKDTDADSVLKRLSDKGVERVEKKDLVPLILTPLMGGSMCDKDRIYQSLHWLKKDYPGISQNDIQKMQAALHALAAKFLNQKDLDGLKEAFTMTLLEQMLLEDVMKKGTKEGIRIALAVLKLSAQGEEPEYIAKNLNISDEMVQEILTSSMELKG